MSIEITYNNGETFTACLTNETYENVIACILDDDSVAMMPTIIPAEEG